eukprot:TRINITY_DN4156_c0_g1_i1.p1 TRINITY_DN4156_c0_g1~~TRINITY_DN4156_c0_g1_i1.p1  ORF type:complete len:720 (-),score=94.39 TRINITY_DN4156_c0_g1_i1:39-2198(-)
MRVTKDDEAFGNFVLFIGVGFIITLQLEYNMKDEWIFNQKSAKTTTLLEQQQKISESMVTNILPENIAKKLKRKRALNSQSDGVIISEHFKNVTVLCADIVGFTELSSRHSAEAIVNILNELFSSFDLLCEKYGVEKLKTIGDAYIAVGGIPYSDSNHARAVIEMAIDMSNDPHLIENTLGERLGIRIGIASGSVLAGVIGSHRWTYDCYGPPMQESEAQQTGSLSNRVRISKATIDMLEEPHLFHFEPINGTDDALVLRSELNTGTWTNQFLLGSNVDVNDPVQIPNVPLSKDVQFKRDSKFSTWTLKFYNPEREIMFRKEFKDPKLAKQMKPHLIVGFIMLCFFFVQDLVETTRTSLLMTAVLYPLSLVSTVVLYLLRNRVFQKGEIFTGWIFTLYLSLVTYACLTPLLSPTPEKILPRIELYTTWVIATPCINLWSVVVLILVQYTGGILLFLVGSVNSPYFPNSFESPIYHRFPIQLILAKWLMVRIEKKMYISIKVHEIKETSMKQEEVRTHSLLLNILPEHIIKDLNGRKLSTFIAKSYPDVSCMFIKLVGAEFNSPTEMTSLLNGVFSLWDRLTQSLSLEKIKTIGLSYMVVGGVDDQGDHLINMAKLAFSIRQNMPELNSKYAMDMDVSIGISLGPCVGGIVGKKKFCYDVWGDTINQASRMESHGKSGSIHITKEVAQELKIKGVYKTESRGIIPIKGKGKVETFFLYEE